MQMPPKIAQMWNFRYMNTYANKEFHVCMQAFAFQQNE